MKAALLTLDHADIVGSVPDGQSDDLLVLLHQLHHLGLLQRSDPAANHRLTHAGCPQQLQLQVLLQTEGLRATWKEEDLLGCDETWVHYVPSTKC